MPEHPQLTMYSTSWCGYCHRLAGQLDRAGIEFSVVDIEADADAAALVEQINQGNRTVPTVRVLPGDGAAEVVMTNPSLAEVKHALGLS
jgi:mycoredoxin